MPTCAYRREPGDLGRSGLLLWILLTLCLVPIGCATQAENTLQPPTVAASESNLVNLLVATTRKPSKDAGQLYSGERGTAISLDSVTVTIPPDKNRKIGEIQRPSRLSPDPDREFAMVGVDKVATERQVFDWFRKNRTASDRCSYLYTAITTRMPTPFFVSLKSFTTQEPTQRQFSSRGHQGPGCSAIFTTKRAPITRAGPWRI